MPSIRKRIGYLPLSNIQEIITSIAKQEKLSQSKVVGILVEEALLARGLIELNKKDNLNRKTYYNPKENIYDSLFNHNDIDELISDKGITYNTKKYKPNLDNILSERSESYIEELFEQFKQFIIFQKMIQKR